MRVIKLQFDHVKVRYRGLAKNAAQLHTLFALSKLWMVRRQLGGVQAWMRMQKRAMRRKSVIGPWSAAVPGSDDAAAFKVPLQVEVSTDACALCRHSLSR